MTTSSTTAPDANTPAIETWHVVVTGSRPDKGSDGKFLPVPQENVDFIHSVLNALDPRRYVALYHGTAAGVDTIVDDYAYHNHIRVKQFPAYWYKNGQFDKSAGLFRNEVMIRAAFDATHNRPTEGVVLLSFYNTADLASSRGTHHATTFAQKKQIQTRIFQLPVLKASAQAVPFQQPA